MNANELVIGEWIEMAEEDFGSAVVLAGVPYYAPACSHCQQSAEKILKAYIIAKENRLIKTHDLNELVERCERHSSDFGKFKNVCSDITLYATVRYPPIGKITAQDAQEALKDVRDILDFTKLKLKELGEC